jgi:hypothetical protein
MTVGVAGCICIVRNWIIGQLETKVPDLLSLIWINIDMNVFRNDFNGKYILSRAEILNTGALGLSLVNDITVKKVFILFICMSLIDAKGFSFWKKL